MSAARNPASHRMVAIGVTVEHLSTNGTVRDAQVRVIDFDAAAGNDWLSVN